MKGDLPQPVIPGQSAQGVPSVQVVRDPLIPYTIILNLGGGGVTIPFPIIIDKRTQHLRIVHGGVTTVPGLTLIADLLFSWQEKPTSAIAGIIYPGDELLFDALFLESVKFSSSGIRLWLDIGPLGTPTLPGPKTNAGVHALIYGW